jgi:hypothetical protein
MELTASAYPLSARSYQFNSIFAPRLRTGRHGQRRLPNTVSTNCRHSVGCGWVVSTEEHSSERAMKDVEPNSFLHILGLGKLRGNLLEGLKLASCGLV